MNNIIKECEISTEKGIEKYKIVNESCKDDYGSWGCDYVPYIKKNSEDWKRLSPEYYALTLSEAMRYMPHNKNVCPTCGHTTLKVI